LKTKLCNTNKSVKGLERIYLILLKVEKNAYNKVY